MNATRFQPARIRSYGRWRLACGWLSVALAGAAVWAQTASELGSVSGTLRESWEGQPLGGATVTVRGTTLATTTNPQGQYQIDRVPVGDQILRFSRSGYVATVVTEVRVLAGQTTRVDGALRPEFFELEEYEVTAAEFGEQSVQLLEDRQQASGLLDSISSEQFSRVGASDAADIVSKVPGITISEGKNPVVRGLNERYVGVTLNGAEVPSADPYKKSVQLDMFPAGLIQSVVVNKSFTPDQPGNFTGGGVNIVTKSFPERFALTLGAGVEFNTRATFRDDFPTYRGGETDWLAIDDGTRALPEPLAVDDLVIPPRVSNSGLPSSANYERNQAQAQGLEEQTLVMGPTQFGPTMRTAPPNNSFGVALGDTVKVFDRDLGLFGGLTYKRNFLYLEGLSRRYQPGADDELEARKDFVDTRGITEANWAAVANVAFRMSENHEFNFNFLFNQNAEDVARTQVGTITDDPEYTYYLNRLHWTERNLTTYQLKGSHTIPEAAGLKVDWLGALSGTTQEEPDARFFNYRSQGSSFEPDHQSLPTPNKPTRYFRSLDENNRNLKLDLTQPFEQWFGLESALKAGLYDSTSDRSFLDREIYYEGLYGSRDAYPFGGDPNELFPPGSLGYTAVTNTNGRINYTWNRYIQTRESVYQGDQQVTAGYLMLDLPVWERLKLIGGARYETTLIEIASRSYLPNQNTGQTTNQTTLDEVAVLPAAGLVFNLVTNMNVRVAFSETLARPSFRELAAYRSYDPLLDEILEGNPNLRTSSIRNFDLRWEWFPQPGDVLAVSLFYKDLTDAIERRFLTIGGEVVSFLNRESAEVYGVELEARRGLGFITEQLSEFSVGLNAALMQSEVPLTAEEIFNRTEFLGDTSTSRPLYDQSPYILNVDFTFDRPVWGTTATVAFNVFGPRIVIAGLNTPDVYEQPTPSLDVVITKRFGDHFKLQFAAKNLLDPVYKRTYGEEADAPAFSSHQRGRLFGISLGYQY